MTPVRIIGIGSPQGADRLAWDLVERLRQSGFENHFPPGSLSLEICSVPAQLHRLLDGCRFAILIDAVRMEKGKVLHCGVDDLERLTSRYSVHGIGVAEMLDLVNTLAESPPSVMVYGIGVGDETLPVITEQQVRQWQRRLVAVLEKEADFVFHFQ